MFRPSPLVLMVLLLASSQACQSQVLRGALSGSVLDPQNAAIPNAEVRLTNRETGVVLSTTTGSDGRYLFPAVSVGTYDLSVSANGFKTSTQRGVVLVVGSLSTVDVHMEIGDISSTVEVTAEAPLIDATKTQVSQVVATEQIQDLPISGRMFTDFVLLAPGVTTGRIGLQSTFTDPAVTRVSFGGQRDLNNSITVDGADNINTVTGSQRATPPQESVQEYQVVNATFQAAYGRALGGIVNIVTKSGTNSFHGSIYNYLQNSAVNARSILTLPGLNTLRQNQFGADIGGPLHRDTTFFFINYEGQRRVQSPTYPALLVQNLTAINAVKASYGLAPENLNVVTTGDVDTGLLKFDHEFSKKNRVSARYSIQDATNLNMLIGQTLDGGGIGAPSSARNGILRDQAVVGILSSQFSDTKVNDILFQWAQRNYGFSGTTGQPNLDIPNVLTLGHNFGAFERYDEKRTQFGDTFSWIHGTHLAKFGFDTNYIQNFVINPGFTPGRAVFPNLADFVSSGRAGWGSVPCPPPLVGFVAPCIEAFFWGAPVGSGPVDPNVASPSLSTTWQNPFQPSLIGDFSFHLNHSYYGFFAQDQWHLTQNLTVNYGLREDFETGLGFFVNPHYNEIQPRIGLAYGLNSKTVIRSGYGLFYDKYNSTFFFVSSQQRPPVIQGLPTNKNQGTGEWLLNSLFLPTQCVLLGCPTPVPGAPLPPGTVPAPLLNSAFENLISNGIFPKNSLFVRGGTVVDRHLVPPYSEQASLEIQREISKSMTINIGYLFVAAHHLVRAIDLNVSPPIGVETGTNKDIYNFRILDPNIPAPPGGSPGTNGIFYFTDSTGNSAYHGATLQATEKAGKYFTLSAVYTLSHTLDDGTFVTFVSTPQSNAQRNLERANSNQDARHRFVANFLAYSPDRWKILGNFELSSIVTLQSPRPFTLFSGSDANNSGNLVANRVGALPRNSYRGDSLRTVDLRIARSLKLKKLKETRRLRLSVDIFNLFNRANVDEVFSVYGAPDLGGPQPMHFGDGITGPSGQVGTPRTVFNPRQFQFAAQFTF